MLLFCMGCGSESAELKDQMTELSSKIQDLQAFDEDLQSRLADIEGDLGCGECGSGLVGKWKCGFFPITIYEDGVASFSGMKAAWSAGTTDSIRLELTEDGQTMIAELEIGSRNAEGKRLAIYKLAGQKTECEEVEEERLE